MVKLNFLTVFRFGCGSGFDVLPVDVWMNTGSSTNRHVAGGGVVFVPVSACLSGWSNLLIVPR